MSTDIYGMRGQPFTSLEEAVIRAMLDGCTSYKAVAKCTRYSIYTIRQAGWRVQQKAGADNLVHLAFMLAGHVPQPSNLLALLAVDSEPVVAGEAYL